jgi:hypothetical protein
MRMRRCGNGKERREAPAGRAADRSVSNCRSAPSLSEHHACGRCWYRTDTCLLHDMSRCPPRPRLLQLAVMETQQLPFWIIRSPRPTPPPPPTPHPKSHHGWTRKAPYTYMWHSVHLTTMSSCESQITSPPEISFYSMKSHPEISFFYVNDFYFKTSWCKLTSVSIWFHEKKFIILNFINFADMERNFIPKNRVSGVLRSMGLKLVYSRG